MKKKLAALFALIGWFAVITQLILMIDNRVASLSETIIRFFSFFTILTNTLVAFYFTSLCFTKNESSKPIGKPGVLTANTVYITVVGLVYQVALRPLWHPEGLQMIVDELLHSVVPVLTIIFWCLYETTTPIKYTQAINWVSYPLIYLAYILVRGHFSYFYPYPFVNVANLGMTKVLINAGILLLLFFLLSAAFIFIGKSFIKRD